MPAKTLTFLKTKNGSFDNVLDSMFNLKSDNTVEGEATFSGPLLCSGVTKLQGAVTMSGATQVTGVATLAGETKIQGATTISGDSTFSGITKLTGATTMSGNAKFTGQTVINKSAAVVSGSLVATENAFTGAEGVLVEAIHSGKTILMPDAPADSTLLIPTPSKAGITYKLVYHGIADDTADMVVKFSDDACYFKGNLLTHDEDLSTAAATAVVFANGSTHDVLTLNDPHAYCIEMVSLSTTVMAIWGYVVSDTVAAFSAAD